MVLGRPEWASTERGGGRLLLLLLGSALGEEDRVDVGEDTAVGDSNARKELGELLVVADGELDVAGDDARLLVVAGGVAGELEDLGTEVLEDGREVDGGASTDTVGVLALLEVPGDAADGELEPGLSVGNGGGERVLEEGQDKRDGRQGKIEVDVVERDGGSDRRRGAGPAAEWAHRNSFSRGSRLRRARHGLLGGGLAATLAGHVVRGEW